MSDATSLLAAATPSWPVRDLVVGTLALALPPLASPTILRLAPTTSPFVDGARATYLRHAAADLRATRAAWAAGPALAVDPAASDHEQLRREVFEVAHALRPLGDERIAQSYLALNHVHEPKGGE